MAATAEQLLDAAERVIAELGPEASMAAMAAEAGVSKPILYRSFGDKSGLFSALAARHSAALLAALRTALRAASTGPDCSLAQRRGRLTRAVIATYVSYVRSQPQVYWLLTHSAQPEIAGQLAGAAARITEVLAKGLALEFEQPTASAATWAQAAAIVGAVRGATEQWLADPALAEGALVETLAALLCHGWGSAAPAQPC